jgi:hypothetical protein
MAVEKLVHPPLSPLARVLDREYLNDFSLCESFKLYTYRNTVQNEIS